MKTAQSVYEQFLERPQRRRIYEQERLLFDVTELLSEIMEKKGISRAELAHRLGKSKAFITQTLRGTHNMTLRTLADLFHALEMQVLVQAAPLLTDRSRATDYKYYAGSSWNEHFTLQYCQPMIIASPSFRGHAFPTQSALSGEDLDPLPTSGVAA